MGVGRCRHEELKMKGEKIKGAMRRDEGGGKKMGETEEWVKAD